MTEQKVLWLEDQIDDLETYRSALFMEGFLVDMVRSVSEAIEKLHRDIYVAVIFDIKVLPGNDPGWKALDKKKRTENSDFDSYLGLELLHSLFKPEAASIKISPPIDLDAKRVIVLSVVANKSTEIVALGIPEGHVKYKSASDLKTLAQLIQSFPKIQ